jgi:hypothetical protein
MYMIYVGLIKREQTETDNKQTPHNGTHTKRDGTYQGSLQT